jgi:formate hydrogenlyase subunit 6/NADH:ubiquinone oxidoreductase subunit I
MYCGLCEEICPVDVINMSTQYEISERSREALLLTPEHMMAREGVEG